jgi:hypothetical protein
VSHSRKRASALALIALTGAVVATGSGTAGADPAVSPELTIVPGQAARSVEVGAAVVVEVNVSSDEALPAPLNGSAEGVRVCAIGPSLIVPSIAAAETTSPGSTEESCVGWIEAGDRNNAKIRVLVNPTSGSNGDAVAYSIVAFDGDSNTALTQGLPAVTIATSVTATAEPVARVFQQQGGLQYWVASPDTDATFEARVGTGSYNPLGAEISRFGGGFVFNQVGAPPNNDVIEIRAIAGDGSTVVYRNVGLDLVPSAPTLTGVPTGTRFTSAAEIDTSTALPANGAKWFRVGPDGTWQNPGAGAFTIPAGEPDGTYTVSGQLADGAARPGAITTSAAWTVDSTAPTVTGAPTGSVDTGADVTLVASKSGAASYRISTDGGTTFGTAQTSGSFTVPNPSTGARNIQIKAVDAVGGESLAAVVTYNVVAPGSAPDYLIVDIDGTVTPFPSGTSAPARVSAPHDPEAFVLEIAYTPDRLGAYTMDDTGFVVAYGTATLKTANPTNVPITSWADDEIAVGLSVTPSGNGYWVFTNRGRSLAYGDATDFQDIVERGITLNQPMVDAAAAVGTDGVYLVAEDGGVFAFGDAPFFGALPGLVDDLNEPVIGILPSAGGYQLVATDGGVFSFGTTQFQGSIPGLRPVVTLNAPISAMVNRGTGYLLVAEDGGVFAFGTPFSGSLGATGSGAPVTGIAAR